jgi:hypothetical protein
MQKQHASQLENIGCILGMIAIFWLFGANGRHEYSYYTGLRFVTCGAAALIAIGRFNRIGADGIVILLGVVAALYNPIATVHLTKDIWWPINLATIPILGFTMWKTKTE